MLIIIIMYAPNYTSPASTLSTSRGMPLSSGRRLVLTPLAPALHTDFKPEVFDKIAVLPPSQMESLATSTLPKEIEENQKQLRKQRKAFNSLEEDYRLLDCTEDELLREFQSAMEEVAKEKQAKEEQIVCCRAKIDHVEKAIQEKQEGVRVATWMVETSDHDKPYAQSTKASIRQELGLTDDAEVKKRDWKESREILYRMKNLGFGVNVNCPPRRIMTENMTKEVYHDEIIQLLDVPDEEDDFGVGHFNEVDDEVDLEEAQLLAALENHRKRKQPQKERADGSNKQARH
jgi:hypothetical protein